MTSPTHFPNPDPWAGSPTKPSLPSDPMAAWRKADAETEARDRRQARRYGTYWAVVTVLFGVSAVVGLVTGDAWGLFALLLAGGTGWYSRYLYRGGKVRIMIIPLPF
jgi:hypothetical protein